MPSRECSVMDERLQVVDYKGEFLLGNHQYCYPLTVTDHASRFLLTCEVLSSTCEDYASTVSERLLRSDFSLTTA
jgi:hypothetical protein